MKTQKKRALPEGLETDLPAHVLKYIEECRLAPRPESYLISVLQKIQQHFGYLSPDRLDAVAHLMQVPTAKVSGVATFYHFFSFVPKGEHRITVCLGTACYVKGAAKLVSRIQELLGIEPGETTPDGRFSLDAARCLGSCALAPVMVVDDKVYGNVQVEQIAGILAEYGFDSRARPALS